MTRILLATKNKHKTKEFAQLFGEGINIEDLNTLQYDKEIIENGKNFIENALIKCEALYRATGETVLADDSGLVVTALGGRPGIYSARYGGDGLTDQARYELLLEELGNAEERSAAFVCALVLYFSPSRIYVIQEETRGVIAEKPAGVSGFGYDPVFFLPEFGRTMAELSDAEKNAISHRGRAARIMKQLLLDPRG